MTVFNIYPNNDIEQIEEVPFEEQHLIDIEILDEEQD
jgi:hypothetical protein